MTDLDLSASAGSRHASWAADALRALRRHFAGTRATSPDARHDRRNALMLQTVLAVTGIAALSIALASHIATGDAEHDGHWGAFAVGAYAWTCFWLSHRGRFRLAAALTVLGGLVLIGLSYANYGLQAQSGLQMTHLMPLLFAGLLLGRAAVWWTALANAVALAIGAWVDLAQATNTAAASAVLPSLLLSAMHFLVLAVILDRLILSSQQAIQRSEALDALCVELEHEIEQRERAYARLLQTQRMEAIGRLSTGVAHDFNNILSVILGLASSPARRDAAFDTLSRIRQAAQRGAVITRRLLSFSRTQARQTSVFDLAEAVDAMRPLIEPMFHRGIRLHLDLSASGLLVETDRDELELALLNIAGNACDAMPDGGRFSLRIERDDDHALIRIEDTGTGMEAEVVERLFEPFFTTKPRDRGTGIGMSIVHRFVVDSGGGIDVDSAPGDGTRIGLRLPLAKADDADPHDDSAQALRILLVTGDPGLLQLATTTLSTQGCHPIHAADAGEAISHALCLSAIDMVIVDHDIPGSGGPALLGQMGKLLPGTGRALVSDRPPGDLDDPDILQLPKAFTREQLLDALSTLARNQPRTRLPEAADQRWRGPRRIASARSGPA